MAPLVPTYISAEFDFVIAFLVGIGFGFALEQAGFSSTRKLVGLFYGYDFTVLRVFFTAGITAMIGVIVLAHFGLLNLEAIYINPTFLWPAIVGGLIMGVGFIVGGFCPGTSLCSLAVGRIDAFFFVIGSVLGILLFTEIYPLVEPLYMAGDMGAPTINSIFGISAEAFGLILLIVALSAFVGTAWIQSKVTHKSIVLQSILTRKYAIAGILPIIVLIVIAVTPTSEERLLSKVEQRFTTGSYEFETMSTQKLAFELVHNSHSYNIIDVTNKDSVQQSIPGFMHIPLNKLHEPQNATLLKQKYKTNIFVADNFDDVREAAILASELGDDNPVIYIDEVNTFRFIILEKGYLDHPEWYSDTDKAFFEKASTILNKVENRLKLLKAPPPKKAIKAKGGCA